MDAKPKKRGKGVQGLYVPIAVAENTKLSWSEKAIYSYLLFRQGENGHCWPSQETISKHLGISTRQIRRAASNLVAMGMIRAEPANEPGRKHLIYQILGAQTPKKETPEPPSGGDKTGQNDRTRCPATPDKMSGEYRTGCPPIPDKMSDNKIQYKYYGKEQLKEQGGSNFFALLKAKIAAGKYKTTEERVGHIADNYIERLPFVKARCHTDLAYLHRLVLKVADSIGTFGDSAVVQTIENNASKITSQSDNDDGWGYILTTLRNNAHDQTAKALAKGMTPDKYTEQQKQEKLKAALRKLKETS